MAFGEVKTGNRHRVSPHPSFDRRPHTWKVISDSF